MATNPSGRTHPDKSLVLRLPVVVDESRDKVKVDGVKTTAADPYVEVISEKCVPGPHSDGKALAPPGIYIYA